MSEIALADPNKRYSFKIIKKDLITHDTYLFSIELPDPKMRLGAKAGEHIFLIGAVNNEEVYHKYTPVNLEEQTGSFDLVIKIYRPCEQFPLGGRLTQYLESLHVGDRVSVEGPFGRCVYLHDGNFSLKHEKDSPRFDKHVKQLGMVAGGSGITPFLQIINTICNDSNDPTQISLIFANHTENDIICRKELDSLAEMYPHKFKVWYTISRSIEPDWKYDTGHVNAQMFSKHLPSKSENTLIMVCGPKGFVFKATIPTLESLGYPREMIFKY